MALKGDRNYNDQVDISFFMSYATGERGGIVIHDTSVSGSGAAMDDANALVRYPTGLISGQYPAGLLLNDVVNLDLTRQHINQHKDEVQLGGKVTLLRRGVVVTNMITAGQAPGAGNNAYVDTAGNLTPTSGANYVKVGRFLSKKDADGYAKVEINIV
jgi:hypothetical protein